MLDDQAQAFAQVEQKRKDEALARQLASEGEPERPASPARRPRQSGRLAEPKGGAALPSPSAAASEAGQALPRAPASKSAVPQDARQGGGRGEGSGPRDGADSSEGGQQDLESHVSPLSTPSSSPGRAAGGSADTHSAVRGAGGVDVGDDGPSASGQHSASSNPDVALAHGAQGAKGEVDAEVGARAFGAGGLAFDIPPELLADVDTQAFLHEQVCCLPAALFASLRAGASATPCTRVYQQHRLVCASCASCALFCLCLCPLALSVPCERVHGRLLMPVWCRVGVSARRRRRLKRAGNRKRKTDSWH